MRVGMNPLREQGIEIAMPGDVPVVCVITHLPSLEQEYHAQRMGIVKAAVQTAHMNAGVEHWFVVWDNGSCDELRDWLLEQAPDQLVLSQNIGKQNALNMIYGMYSGCIVAISDDDILHYPGWLKMQLDILISYPDVGLVSGCTTRWYSRYNHLYGYQWAIDHENEIVLANIPGAWDIQHGASIGKSEQETNAILANAPACELQYNGTKAIIGGNHCQFVGYADDLRPFLPCTGRYMQPLYEFDLRVDRARLLRLLTPERTARHLGNVLTDTDRQEIHDLVVTIHA